MKTRNRAALFAILGFTTSALILSAASTTAEARPHTKSYSCSALKSFINRRGAVVMNYKGNSVYHRFVANRLYCDREEVTRRFTVPSKNGSCRIFICREPIDKLFFGR